MWWTAGFCGNYKYLLVSKSLPRPALDLYFGCSRFKSLLYRLGCLDFSQYLQVNTKIKR
jgi:hypothetical protein